MDAIFTAEVRLTYEDLKEFTLYHELRKGDKYRPAIMVAFGGAALLLCALAWQLLLHFNWYYVAYILILLLLPAGRYLVLMNRAKQDHAEYAAGGGMSRYDFTESSVLREKTDASGTKKAEFKYDDYVRIVKTKKAFYLYITENEVNVVPLGSLMKGEPMELAKFLNGKMGDSFVIMN